MNKVKMDKMERYDAIIIGAGFSGMLCGALLSGYGKRVLVVERSNYIGGRVAKKSISKWGWGKSRERISYGPHIFPAKGHAEDVLNDLGIINKIKLRKLILPKFYKNGEFLAFPGCILNPFEVLGFLLRLSKVLKIKEIFAFLKIGLIAAIESETDLIREYERMSCHEFLKRNGINSTNGRQIIAGIIGGYCFNDDIRTCPALDLLINLKLFIKGILSIGTIMYDINGGYNSILVKLEEIIKKNKGRLLLGKEAKFIGKNESIEGILIDDKKIFGNVLIFTGTPKQFAAVLTQSRRDPSFLNEYNSIGEARVIDFIVSSKKRVHHENTTWISIFSKNFGYVIIDEETKAKAPYVYHVCIISHNKTKINRIAESMKNDFKKFGARLGFNFGESVLQNLMVELVGYGVEKNISLPYSKRSKLKTPYKNLYWIGDSKGLTVGTDGCAYSTIRLVKELLNPPLNQ